MANLKRLLLVSCLALVGALLILSSLDTSLAAANAGSGDFGSRRTATPIPTRVRRTRTPMPSRTRTPTPTPTTPSGGIWQPQPITSWQWQLSGTVNQSFNVQMYDIDMFDNHASVVAALHAQRRKVICYISAGTWEDWRSDANQFPPSVIGNPDAGWPGEKWLDIRRIDILGPIMQARMDQCKLKGFDGLEPDNIDGYANNTGFPLTYPDQINYDIFIANAAHARGLSVGLKNDLDQVNNLLSYFDWALDEECFYYQECSALTPFVSAGKAVFEVEYTDDGMTLAKFCRQADTLNFNSLLKRRNLGAGRQACR
jgi:endo-alpha-1,4-polygalactosaminidase (GH114 family)